MNLRFSLRVKLSLVSLLLFLIPLIGFRFGGVLTQDLLESRREALLFSAQAVASALSGRSGLLEQELFHALNKSRDLYLFPLTNAIRLNGKTDDWMPQLNEAEEFGAEHLLSSAKSQKFSYNSIHFKHLFGERGQYIYAIFLVTDDTVVYRQPNALGVNKADHLQIGIEDQKGHLLRYVVSTTRPGWINGFRMPDDPKEHFPILLEKRIQGFWNTTDHGYIIEMRLPKEMVGDKFAFAIADVDDPETREITSVIGTANPKESGKLGWLLSPSKAIEDILHSMSRPQSRILIVDTNQRIRASLGSLSSQNNASQQSNIEQATVKLHKLLGPIYKLFTTPFSETFTTPTALPTTLDISGIGEALQGTTSTTSYRLPGEQVEIMAAMAPLTRENEIIGAVVVEQTTNSILALQNQVIEESITFTILAFVFAAFCLLLFASRLSSRIRKLRDQAARAISETGQIRSSFDITTAQDEIGDLTRSLSIMLAQLKQQSDYRETMADNLEHEMRTPLAGISASLQNIRNELSEPSERVSDYLEWAMADARRLEELLSAIRDATSLEEALSRDTHEDFDLAEALDVWLKHSWGPAFQEVQFLYSRPSHPCLLHGDPGRIKQLLDKLVENAVGFHKPGTPLEIEIVAAEQQLLLSVTNWGSSLAEEHKDQIFNAMVSRRKTSDNKPHLGLGLYVARTIALHHRATIHAENLSGDLPGVRMTLNFPVS